MSNSSVFKSRLKVLRSSADLQSYDSEFQTEGALMQNAFADNVSDISSTACHSLSADHRVGAGSYVALSIHISPTLDKSSDLKQLSDGVSTCWWKLFQRETTFYQYVIHSCKWSSCSSSDSQLSCYEFKSRPSHMPTNTPSQQSTLVIVYPWSIYRHGASSTLLAVWLDQRSVSHGSTAYGPFSIVDGLSAPHRTLRLSHLSTLQWCWWDGRTSGVTLPSTRPGVAGVMAKSPLSNWPWRGSGRWPVPPSGMRERERESSLEQAANLLCAQANSASYPQQYGK